MASRTSVCFARQLHRASRPRSLPWRQTSATTQSRAFVGPTAARRRPEASKSTAAASTRQHVSPRAVALLASIGLLSFACALYRTPPAAFDAAAALHSEDDGYGQAAVRDDRDPSLPRFRMSEIRSHHGKSERPWVTHADKVYDITDWVSAHPGGPVILRAAGGSIEPYWNIFTIHKSQYVRDILDQYLIGYVDQADLVNGSPAQETIEDPFADDPARHPDLITRTLKPRNAETPAHALGAHFITPNELFYVRNHMWVPRLTRDEAEAHVLTVELPDGTTKEYTLRDLKTKFAAKTVTAVLQCSGNRRSHMSQGSGRPANGLPWGAGAISNASWEGVLLADVLADAGFDASTVRDGTSEAQHVHFSGMEAYGSSIPIKKAVDPQGDVLLAYGMNGDPLPRDHGYPLRSVVPGHVAARSVKWLSHITLSDEESPSQWQRKDYKCFGPNQTTVDWETAPAIQELPVQSAITGVKLGGWAAPGNRPAKEVFLNGYAYSGGGRSVIRVDVSLDDGKSWSQADLLPNEAHRAAGRSWSWKQWRFSGAVPLEAFNAPEDAAARRDKDDEDGTTIRRGAARKAAGEATRDARGDRRRCTTIAIKATDEAYNTQPESHAATWNLRGNLATAWHRVRVCTDCSPDATGSNKDRSPPPRREEEEEEEEAVTKR
ncbi:sulfite oxidase [Trichoderma cornu-damae]|uniref:Nitrate reductase [NADPH] n=1 Tax=Trichoderma cornu-damae TaxID=654480 RepID=A0A9P8TV02_9HYPO|nr:sulfite oxidase [Trichoderma cornu-damae]